MNIEFNQLCGQYKVTYQKNSISYTVFSEDTLSDIKILKLCKAANLSYNKEIDLLLFKYKNQKSKKPYCSINKYNFDSYNENYRNKTPMYFHPVTGKPVYVPYNHAQTKA